jgi:hypothetical protein
MILPPKVIHPTGEPEFTPKKTEISALIADTFNGKIHIEWDPQAPVTTLGQLAFFVQFLKTGHRFMPWVEDCPLHYTSPNAPKKSMSWDHLCCPFWLGIPVTPILREYKGIASMLLYWA